MLRGDIKPITESITANQFVLNTSTRILQFVQFGTITTSSIPRTPRSAQIYIEMLGLSTQKRFRQTIT